MTRLAGAAERSLAGAVVRSLAGAVEHSLAGAEAQSWQAPEAAAGMEQLTIRIYIYIYMYILVYVKVYTYVYINTGSALQVAPFSLHTEGYVPCKVFYRAKMTLYSDVYISKCAVL